jgi:hypothetical protein
MSNQLYNVIGLEEPLAYRSVGGTTASLSGHATLNWVRGEIVELVPTYSDTDPGAFKYTGTAEPTTAATGAAGLLIAQKHYGVCLEDIAAGESGLILLRGSALALCGGGGGADITSGLPLYTGMGDSNNGAGLLLQNGILDNTVNAGTNVYVKAIAIFGGSTSITDPTAASLLRPVTFNGIEGVTGTPYLEL